MAEEHDLDRNAELAVEAPQGKKDGHIDMFDLLPLTAFMLRLTSQLMLVNVVCGLTGSTSVSAVQR